ncbi:hypothetical protein ACWCPJ_29180 [Streptomyces collinus]
MEHAASGNRLAHGEGATHRTWEALLAPLTTAEPDQFTRLLIRISATDG